MRHFHLLGLFFFLTCIQINAQNKTLPQVTPKSPNVAALDKFIEVPVSLSSGRLNLNVPLCEINVGSVKVPITLDYNNNGLMPDEIPSWVGHGWSLNTGGMISYHQHGLNDFKPVNGMFAEGKQRLDSFFASAMNSFQVQMLYEDIMSGDVDAEYDSYTYSFPGQSGSFYFTSPTEAHLNPKTDISVSKTDSGFKAIDDIGNTFFFEAQEFISSVNSAAISPDFSDNSSYYLSKIIASNGRIATFKYKSYYFQYTRTSESIYHVAEHPISPCPSSSVNYNDNLTTAYYLLPDSIIFPEGYIKFNHSSTGRADLNAIDSTNVPYLQSLSIYNYLNEKIKDFNFYCSYFGSNSRLRLDSLVEVNGSLIGRKWKFGYYGENNILPIFGKAKDHWGYANANTATSTIPMADYSSLIPNWTTHTPDYADRTSNFGDAVQGMIENLTYPSGGTVQFNYEPNQFKLRKFADYPFSPFLQIPTTSYTNLLATETENAGGTDTGSFNITDTGYYMLSAFRQISPDPFYDDADVTFGGPSASNLNTPITESCISSSCSVWQRLVYLLPGHYTYTVKGSYYVNSYGTFYLAANFSLYGQDSGPVYYPVGGCRIANITYTDSVANSRVFKRYIYDDTISKVSFKQIPYYITSIENYVLAPPIGCAYCSSAFTVHDESVMPFAGNVIEYSSVTELNDSSGSQGSTHTNLMLSENIGGTTAQPATAPVNTGWRLGSIIDQETYSNSGVLLKKTENIDSTNFLGTQVNGLKAIYSEYCQGGTYRSYATNITTLFSESFRKDKSVNTLFSGSNHISKTDSFYYNLQKHNRPTGSKADNSNNTQGVTKLISIFDYDSLTSASSSDALAMKYLKQMNNNAPVEEIDLKYKAGVQYVTGGLLRKYKENNNGLSKIYQLKISSPRPVSSFSFSHVSSGGVFIYDSAYVLRAEIERYDSLLNVSQQRVAGDVWTSIIWDYRSLYPVAEASNTDSSSIAYTSFDAEGKGNWSFTGAPVIDYTSPMGKNVYVLNGSNNITKSGLNNGTVYTVSYWTKNSSALSITGTVSGYPVSGRSIDGWRYFEHHITGQTTIIISGSGSIDELRLYPANAQMKSYAYDPLLGLTSQCDANNRITYYEYDKLGRLSLIRDQDKKVIKKICYNYAGQPEDCSSGYFANVLKTGSFTKNDCGSGRLGTVVIDSVLAGTYTSPFGQAYVDSLAQADVTANGQANANAKGSCVCDTLVCTPSDPSHKCVNGSCESGTAICVSSVLDFGSGLWVCTWYYFFSDCSSNYGYVTYTSGGKGGGGCTVGRCR